MTSTPRRAHTGLLLVTVLALVLAGCSGRDGDPRPAPVPSSALTGTRLWIDPEGHGVRQFQELLAAGQSDSADALEPLAGEPVARWLTGSDTDPFATSRDATTAATAQGRTATLVAYNLPGRDCGQFSAGGAEDAETYLAWVGALAAGIEDRPAIVILEPDAVPHALEGCAGPHGSAARYQTLSAAVDIFGQQPNVRVYLDAGNSSWIEDLDQLAVALRAGGVGRAAGFSLNVSNFETTRASTDYGHQLSDRLGGSRFVIDTSRNGAGPPPGSGTGQVSSWCNPSGVRLGTPPTTEPHIDRVDALLWVKQPGDSDGDCGRGNAPAGTFQLAEATALLTQEFP